jgi:predicted transcriptional regulator
VEAVLDWMDELRLNQLPVVERGAYLGLLKSELLLNLPDTDRIIDTLPLEYKEVVAGADWTIPEMMPLFHAHQLEIMPVADSKGEYLGVVTLREALQFFSGAFSSMQGGFLRLAMHYRDYSLAEISRLVESNNMRVLNSLIEVDKENPEQIVVTLQINTDVLHRVAATFERFGYQVSYRSHQDETSQMAAERLESFFKYLDI